VSYLGEVISRMHHKIRKASGPDTLFYFVLLWGLLYRNTKKRFWGWRR